MIEYSLIDELCNVEKVVSIESVRTKGAIICDFNGVLYSNYSCNDQLIKTMINLLNLGFKIIINTNNRADEIIDRNKSVFLYKDKFFLDFVEEKKRSNFIVYADNRTQFYLYNYDKYKMEEQEKYALDKGFHNETDREEIHCRLIEFIDEIQNNENLKELHPDHIIPKVEIINKKSQIRIQMQLPRNFEFGNYITEMLEEKLKDYKIEIHVGRTGFYVTRDGLDKSMAVEHAINYFNLNRNSVIYIGDKYGVRIDSDLHILLNCGVLGINVGDKVKAINLGLDKPIIQIGGKVKGTLDLLSYIEKRSFYNNHSEGKEINMDNLIANILSYSNGRGLIVGIEGPAGAGKTTFTNEICDKLKKNNRNVNVIYMYCFMKERSERKKLIDEYIYGKISVENYSKLAWNIDEYYEKIYEIYNIIKSCDRDNILINNAYNRKTGLKDLDVKLDIKENSIILLEGTDFINEDIGKYINICIKVDVEDNNTLLERIINRENAKNLEDRINASILKNRFNFLDIYHAVYLRNKNTNLYDYYLNNSECFNQKIIALKNGKGYDSNDLR